MTFATLISQHKAACFNVFSKKCLLWKILFGKLWSETESIYLSGFNYKVDSLGKDRKGWSRQTHWSPTPACVKKTYSKDTQYLKGKTKEGTQKTYHFPLCMSEFKSEKMGERKCECLCMSNSQSKNLKVGKKQRSTHTVYTGGGEHCCSFLPSFSSTFHGSHQSWWLSRRFKKNMHIFYEIIFWVLIIVPSGKYGVLFG